MAVSSTNVKGFKPRNSIYGVSTMPTLYYVLLDASLTFTLGDLVRIDTNGYLKRCAAGDVPLGVLDALMDQNLINIFQTGRVPATSIAGATLTPSDTVTVSSTNITDGTRNLKGGVIIDPAGQILFQNTGNTTVALTAAMIGQYFNIVTANPGQIDTNTASNSSGIMQLMSIDPDADGNTAKGVYRMAQNQLGSTAIPARAA